MAFIPFVVREPLDQRAAILVQLGVNTAQAYNHWAGKSLYPSNSTDSVPAVKVASTPLPRLEMSNANSRVAVLLGLGLIRFLERHGYDVACTDRRLTPIASHGR